MPTTRVIDMPLSSARRVRSRAADAPAGDFTVFDDFADGALVVDRALDYAGFDQAARQLVVHLIGLVGAGGELKVFDGDLAEQLDYSVRTVRRWRKAYLAASESKRFGPLAVAEGEYVADKKRYEPTLYKVTPELAEFVNLSVAEARASELYGRDRRGALEHAAAEHYDDIPDAPPRRRRRKPRRAPALRIERHFENASRNVEQGRRELSNLPERARAAFVNGRQGAQLRSLLENLQVQIDEVLTILPQAVDRAGDEEVPADLAGTPSGVPAGGEVVPERSSQGGAGGGVTDVYDEPPPTPEDEAAWESVVGRLQRPLVETVEVELRPPPSDDCLPGTTSVTVEDSEAETVRAEGCRELLVEYEE